MAILINNEKTYTVSTRLIKSVEFLNYFEPLVSKYSMVLRLAFNDVQKDTYVFKELRKYYQTKFSIDGRTSNSIIRTAKGLVNAHIELKKYERSQLRFKITSLIHNINTKNQLITSLKPLAKDNLLSKFQLQTYRKTKHILYLLRQKLNSFIQKEENLNAYINNKKYSICFGTKNIFKKQHFMEENNITSHAKWVNMFRKNRDKYITYLGSKSEPCCNQNFQLKYNDETELFDIKIRKDLGLMEDENDKFLYIRNVNIPYQKEIIKDILEHKTSSLTYRIIRKGRKYYLQIMFTLKKNNGETEYSTENIKGTIGLDYNKGFIQLCETNKEGNIVLFDKIILKEHGTGNKAKTEIEQKISKIVRYASNKGKNIIVEYLNFGKKKSQVNKIKKDKNYNKMIHLFDYSRYIKTIENIGFRKRVKVEKINPYKTTIIGERKYGKLKGINRHQAASYVIARKGQGMIDK